MSPADRKMKRQYGKTRYQVMSFFQELIFFFINSFLSFPLHVKIIILCFVYSDDYKPTTVYPSLRKEDFPSCIIDLDLIPSSEPTEKNDVHIPIPLEHDQSCKLVDIKLIYHLLKSLFHPVINSLKFSPRLGKVINL
jgi:hypothetical protein